MLKRSISLILAAVLMLAVCVSAVSAEETSAVNEMYIYTDNTGKPMNVRNAPNGEIIGQLAQGEKVQVVSFVNADWAEIRCEGAGDGPAYVSRRYLIDIDPAVLAGLVAEEQAAYTSDPLTDITAEIETAVSVEPYTITVRPARVTSWVETRWFPCQIGPAIGRYKASEQLIVLKEMAHYLQVQDPDTGDVGYIHKMFAARLY